ncbi:hypothetical protein H0H87_010774, partial [Tephrocybe sp. NHM501043]
LLVVAGADTHLSGGPSHNLLDENAAALASPTPPPNPNPTTDADAVPGLWGDIADDLGLPRPHEIKAAFQRLFQ